MTGARILIVEDERIVAKSIQQQLTKLGYCVVGTAATAEAAVQNAEEKHPDLILMDIHLQGQQDGIAAATQIRRQLRLPIIYLTANSDDQTLHRARTTEPFGYLVKPFDTRELHATIEIALYRAQMEERVQASEERYRDLFENASDAIVTMATDGTISEVNRAAERLLARSRHDLVGQQAHQLIPEDEYLRVAERRQRLHVGELLSELHETEVLRPDGSKVPIEIHSRLIRDGAGQPMGTQAIVHDISERKALERQRADFLAMLTHDIKNPLGVVMGYTEFLLKNAKQRGGGDEEDMLQRLQSNALAIHSLVANYLDFFRIESGRIMFNRQPLLLGELLEKVGKRHAGEALKQHISIAFHKPEESPVVEGDIVSLERVFSNLLHNALKFTPELGCIEIRLEQRNGEAVVSIVDSGPGIPPEEIPTLFGQYVRGRTSQREGSGLGLFIVKTFVEAHGGRVEVKSELGEGSCFTVRLPKMAEEKIPTAKEVLI